MNFAKKKVKDYVKRIENVQGEMESERGSYMAKQRVHRGEIAEIITEAHQVDGIPKKALKAILKDMSLDKRRDAIRAKLDEDDELAFEQLELSLGRAEPIEGEAEPQADAAPFRPTAVEAA